MNILIVANDFKPRPGGVAEYTHQLAKHLSATGNMVKVLSHPTDAGKDAFFDRSCNYEVVRVPRVASQKNLPLRQWKCYRTIADTADGWEADLIVANTVFAYGHLCALAARFRRIPYVVLTFALEIANPCGAKLTAIREIALRSAELVVCISSFAQGLVIRHGVSKESTLIVPGCVAAEEFVSNRPKQSSKFTEEFGLNNRKVIGTLGRLVPRKGIDTVIEALPAVVEKIPDVIYLVGGNGPYETTLRRKAAQRGVERNVVFAGRIWENERQDFYDALDLFAMPCRHIGEADVEGFGIVFTEANACGVPTVVGRSGGAVEAVEHGKTGLLVSPHNVDEVSNALLSLLANSEKARKMGKRGRRRVEDCFTWGKQVPRLEKYLTSLVEK